jgi:hypothetical protein
MSTDLSLGSCKGTIQLATVSIRGDETRGAAQHTHTSRSLAQLSFDLIQGAHARYIHVSTLSRASVSLHNKGAVVARIAGTVMLKATPR